MIDVECFMNSTIKKTLLMKNKQTKRPTQQKHPVKKNIQIEKSQKNRNLYDLLGIALIIILGIIIYSNSFNCSFHFDDTGSIVDNAAIKNLSDIKAIWNYSNNRFVAYFTFALNYHFGELNVWGYHLMNLMIHLATSIIVWWLTLLIFSTPVMKDKEISKHKKMIALFVALLFVSHPLATQSVTYIVQRMASMVAMFYLLSLALYVKARLDKKGVKKYFLFAGAFISAILALLTKENAYTLPFGIVIVEIFFLQTKKIKVNFKDYRIMLVIVGFLSLFVLIFLNFSSSIFDPISPKQGNPYTITPVNYLLTQFSVIVKYIQLLILPINQNLDYDFPLSNSFFEIRTILCFCILISLLVLAIYLFKKQRIMSFGIFFFFLTLSIESSIIPIDDVIFEHRIYLPSFGFILILISLIYILFIKISKNIAIITTLLIILLNSITTFQRNKVWKDEFSLWNDAILKSPNKARPINNRGLVFSKEGQWEKSIYDFSKAIELNPRFTLAYLNRGASFEKIKDWDNAIEDFNKAIRISPDNSTAFLNRGTVYENLKKYDLAISDYKQVIKLDSNNSKVWCALGGVYSILGQNYEAIADFTKSIIIAPKFSKAYFSRGNVYNRIGKFENAISDFTSAIEIDSNYAQAYSNRGVSFDNLKRVDKAIQDFSKALEIDPKYVDAYINRGLAYEKLGQLDNALADFYKVKEIDPRYTDTYTNYEIAYGKKLKQENPAPKK